MKEEDPPAALSLLENGYSAVLDVTGRISEAKAREHYLRQLPHHAELVEAWEAIHGTPGEEKVELPPR